MQRHIAEELIPQPHDHENLRTHIYLQNGVSITRTDLWYRIVHHLYT